MDTWAGQESVGGREPSERHYQGCRCEIKGTWTCQGRKCLDERIGWLCLPFAFKKWLQAILIDCHCALQRGFKTWVDHFTCRHGIWPQSGNMTHSELVWFFTGVRSGWTTSWGKYGHSPAVGISFYPTRLKVSPEHLERGKWSKIQRGKLLNYLLDTWTQSTL